MIAGEVILSKISQSSDLQGFLQIREKDYSLNHFSVTKSKIPVRKPTTRGGVYFSDTTAYKVKASTKDLSIIDEIPKVMLGPCTDFKPIQIRATLELDGTTRTVTLVAHLTHAMKSKTMVELNLIVDKVQLE